MLPNVRRINRFKFILNVATHFQNYDAVVSKFLATDQVTPKIANKKTKDGALLNKDTPNTINSEDKQ